MDVPTVWAEFISAVLGIAVVVIWRAVNKWLPPDGHAPPPAGVAAATVNVAGELRERIEMGEPDDFGEDAVPPPSGWTPEGSIPADGFTAERVDEGGE